MKTLVTADLHQTDRPQDEYRWGIFHWLAKQARKHKVGRVIILGDVTDAKDKHSEGLVNRLVDKLCELLSACEEIIWVPGNHDGVDATAPFFRFINNMPRLRMVVKPFVLEDEAILFLPHTKDYQKDWEPFGDFRHFEYIFCHQTFDGCVAENGIKLEGIPPSIFAKTDAEVWSGDIHVPQMLRKNLGYVGAPYRIRFGDDFEPRVLLLGPKKGQHEDLHFPCLMKFLIELVGSSNPCEDFLNKLDELDVREKDQVKLRVELDRSAYPDWSQVRKDLKLEAERRGIDLKGPELYVLQKAVKKAPQRSLDVSGRANPERLLRTYGDRQQLPKSLLDAGKGFLRGALEEGD